jgi:hypothetical protein
VAKLGHADPVKYEWERISARSTFWRDVSPWAAALIRQFRPPSWRTWMWLTWTEVLMIALVIVWLAKD